MVPLECGVCTKFQDIVDGTEKINRKSNAKSVEVGDFPTLYTNFGQSSIKHNIKDFQL